MSAIYALLIAFFEYFIGSISVSEIATIIFIGYAAYKSTIHKIDSSEILLIGFLIFSSFAYFIINRRIYFLQSSFFNNLIRLLVYTYGFYIIPRYLVINKKLKILIRYLMFATTLIAIIGIFEFIIQYFLGIDISILRAYEHTTYSIKDIRPSSIFSEPAHFSIFVGISLSLIMEFYHYFPVTQPQLKILNRFIIIILLALVVSFSLVGYAFLIINILFLLRDKIYAKKNIIKIIFFTMTAILILIVLVILLYQTVVFKELIGDRINSVMSLNDLSGRQRLAGSMEIAVYGVKNKSIAGLGLGQVLSYLRTTPLKMEYFYYGTTSAGSGINNMFASIILQTGYLGFSLFIIFVYIFLKFDKLLFLVFIIFSISWGFFNTPFFWFYLYISKSYYIINKRRNNSYA